MTSPAGETFSYPTNLEEFYTGDTPGASAIAIYGLSGYRACCVATSNATHSSEHRGAAIPRPNSTDKLMDTQICKSTTDASQSQRIASAQLIADYEDILSRPTASTSDRNAAYEKGGEVSCAAGIQNW